MQICFSSLLPTILEWMPVEIDSVQYNLFFFGALSQPIVFYPVTDNA